MHPEVSVIIPAYNAARFIGEAIESVLSQTFSAKEIIVVDDGSTDNTKEIISFYSNKINYLYQCNLGPAAARNTGVKNAQGEWIAFLDSDDFWDKDHLEVLVQEACKAKDVVLVYSGNKWVDDNGNKIQDYPKQKYFPSGWIYNDMFHGNYIPTHAVLVKRVIIIELGGFREHLSIAEDYDMWLRIAAVAPICGLPIYTVNYRRHCNNLTLQTIGRYKGVLAVLKNAQNMIEKKVIDNRNKPECIDIRKRMKHYYTDAAVGMFYLGEYKELRSLGIDAIKQCYLTKPILIRWFLSWIPQQYLSILRDIYRKIR